MYLQVHSMDDCPVLIGMLILIIYHKRKYLTVSHLHHIYFVYINCMMFLIYYVLNHWFVVRSTHTYVYMHHLFKMLPLFFSFYIFLFFFLCVSDLDNKKESRLALNSFGKEEREKEDHDDKKVEGNANPLVETNNVVSMK